MKGRATIFISESPLAKRYRLDDAGQLVKTTAAQMTRGSFRVVEFDSAGGLAAIVDSIGTSQALCASVPVSEAASGTVVTDAMLPDNPGAVARTKRHFELRGSPGLLFLDSDDGKLSHDALWLALRVAVPALAGAGVVWRPSGSSHVCSGDDDLTGLKGQHLYLLIADASDGPRVVKILAARLWLAGHGTVVVSKSGALLLRCPIDTAPADAARLIFAGGAICEPPLQQRRSPAVSLTDGGFLDSRSLVPDLTADEEARLAVMVEKAKADKMPEALQRRAEHRAGIIAKRLPELIHAGVPAADAEARIGAAVDATFGGTLLSDFELTVVHDDGRHEVVTVGQVLADRLRWDGVKCLDPVNPEHRGGAPDCKLYLLGTSPVAFSFDSGTYRLRNAKQRLIVNRGARAELVQQLASTVANLDCMFRNDAGPVLVTLDGRQCALGVESLMNVIGSEVELVTMQKNGAAPADLQRETASLVLAALRAGT
jgi:hypothetical protein